VCVKPSTKRAVAFADDQNLFYAVKNAFGCTFPNYVRRRWLRLSVARLDGKSGVSETERTQLL